MTSAASPLPAASRPALPLARYRWAVLSRSLAAIVGGYLLSASVAGALSLLLVKLGVARAEAVLDATMLALLAQAVAALWAFGCRSGARAWAGIVLPAAAFALLGWLLKAAGAAA